VSLDELDELIKDLESTTPQKKKSKVSEEIDPLRCCTVYIGSPKSAEGKSTISKSR
jgi:predicted transcriptional regulator